MSSSVAILIALLAGTLLGVLAGLLIGAARAERSRSATSAADAERFRELSASILAESQQKLVDMNATRMRELTEATAREDIARANAVSAMVNPINERLTELGSTLTRIETSRSEDSGALKQRLESLGQITQSLQNETKILATAMKDNKARGTWGEMQLRRVVELAGLIEHCDFITQVTTEGDTGRLRPDLVVQLPQAKAIVIDSKVPLDAYLAAVNAPDEATRRAMLEKHVRDLGAHVNTLQRADYSAYVSGALDFVVMFVPGDSFLEAAFSANETWFEDSIGKGVFPASPGTLIALLRAISYGWRQEQLAENAAEIAGLGAELHTRLGTFAAHLAKAGRALTTATISYNDAIGSLERSVLPTTRKFERHGVKITKEITETPLIDVSARPISAPELLDVPTDPPLGEGSDPSL